MGHDATCEAVKAACQIPPIPGLPSPEAITSCLHNLLNCPKVLIESVPEVQLFNACVADVPHCPANVLNRLTYTTLQPIIDTYISTLYAQAGNRWIQLPPWFIKQFAANYPEINLANIRYVKNINTIHGANITLGNYIFLIGTDDPGKAISNALFLHELQHSAQWAAKGGKAPFISEYILHSAGQIIQHQNFNVHDDVSLEADAISKSKNIMATYGTQVLVKNGCQQSVRIALAWFNNVQDELFADTTIHSTGYFSASPGESFFPDQGNGERLHLTYGTLYYFGKTADGLIWQDLQGGYPVNMSDGLHYFRKMSLGSSSGWLTLKLNC